MRRTAPPTADELAARIAAVTPDSPATILYTSGTTGNPKGVVLTHHNVLFEAIGTQEAAGLFDPQTSVSYLPLAHIAERILGLYGPQIQGSHMYAIGDPAQLLATLGEVHPTAFFGVPRVWEKIKTGLSAKLAADPNPDNVAMVTNAMAAGLAWVEAQEVGRTMTPEIEEAYQAAEEQILGLLKLLLGLDQVTWAGSAAAPMPLDVAKFMAGLGIKVYDVYGMTETCGAITANGPGAFKLGTVGRATPGMEVTARRGRRGPGPGSGHDARLPPPGGRHPRPHRRGRLGAHRRHRHPRRRRLLRDRGSQEGADHHLAGQEHRPVEHRELPQGVPAHRARDGDRRLPARTSSRSSPWTARSRRSWPVSWASSSPTSPTSRRKPEILAIAQQAVDAANERLSRPEQVKAFELLGVEWTAESDELTPTLKLKRRVVNTKYSDVLDRLYG